MNDSRQGYVVYRSTGLEPARQGCPDRHDMTIDSRAWRTRTGRTETTGLAAMAASRLSSDNFERIANSRDGDAPRARSS